MFLYSKLEYIILSKINTEKIILEKNKLNFFQIFIKSLNSKKNIFKNKEWLLINCPNIEIYNLIIKYSDYKNKEEAQKELELCKEKEIKLLRYEEKRFPQKLKEIESPPILLYYKGNFPLDKSLENSVSIIGSRECYEEFGGKLAYKIGQKLAKEKKWNISGLALGIDTFGHKGSLSNGGYTGAFIAQGLLTELYPKENFDLEKKIVLKKGFIATEYPIFSKIYYKKFTLRNRLQAGIVDFLIIPEFNEKSGTLSTIEYGLKEKREVFICDPRKTLEKNILYKIFNKGNILFTFSEKELNELYRDFNFENFKKSRLYKIKNNKNYVYSIVEKIPKFEKKEVRDKLGQQQLL